MPNEKTGEIFLLDDEQAVIDTARESLSKEKSWRLEPTLLDRASGSAQLKEALARLDADSESLLLLDWLPVERDNEMLKQLTDRKKSPSRNRIILTSWQPPGTFKNRLEEHGLEDWRRLHKPLRWEDVLPDQAGNLQTGLLGRRAITPPSRLRLIHTGQGHYRVHPTDMNKAAFWPLPRFDAEEMACLRRGQEAVKLHRGWQPWSRPNTAMGWYQVVTVARRWQDGKEFPESLWQYAIQCPQSWQPPTPDDAVDNLFKLMAEVGFHRGRYYEIDQLPDAEKTRILQLTRANHHVFFENSWQPSNKVLPIAKTLPDTSELLNRAIELIQKCSPSSSNERLKQLVFEVREACGQINENHLSLGAADDTKFWNTLVGTAKLSARLDIPVYRESQSKSLESLLGWMSFDRLNPLDQKREKTEENDKTVENSGSQAIEQVYQVYAMASDDPGQEEEQIRERVEIVESLVLQAIKQVREEKKRRQTRHSEQQSQQRKALRQRLGKEDSREGREKALVDFAMCAGELDREGNNSSVVFARYAAASKSLTVTVDTAQKLLNQQFPISSNFALAACARSKKLRVVPNWHDLPQEEKNQLEDWQRLPGMDGQRAYDLFQWAQGEILTTVALPVLSKGDSLLGVLLERHKRPYHFSRERIDNLQALVDTALPYMELDAARASADTWDGAVMHEIRSGIQEPYRSLNELLEEPSLSETLRRRIYGILFDIEDLRDLSNTFLENIGNGDPKTRAFNYGVKVGGNWFAALDDYGRHRADRWQGIKPWEASFLPAFQEPSPLLAPDKLIRVVRILVDNAFRYSLIESDVKLFVRQESATVTFSVTSAGEFSESVRQGNFRNVNERLDLGGRALRTHLGLSLADALIREQGGQLRLTNEAADHLAVASFTWPLAPVTPVVMSKGE